jgi:hypothetical protein
VLGYTNHQLSIFQYATYQGSVRPTSGALSDTVTYLADSFEHDRSVNYQLIIVSMQLSANLQRRKPAPALLNHTPRTYEISAPFSPSQFPDGAADMFSAGPSYTNAMMGQAPSAQQREAARKASSSILREDSIHVECEQSVVDEAERDRPDSWSMHHDCTNQAPYSTRLENQMITQSSALRLPKNNESRDLAFFLATTGPTAPHRRPSKLVHPRKAPSAPKHALKFFKFGQRRAPASVTGAHYESVVNYRYREDSTDMSQSLNDILLLDEGGLLQPEIVEQKMSSTGMSVCTVIRRYRHWQAKGKKYLAIKPLDHEKIPDNVPMLRWSQLVFNLAMGMDWHLPVLIS